MLSFWCKLLIKKRQRNVKDGNVHSLMWSNYIKRRTKNGARWEEWRGRNDLRRVTTSSGERGKCWTIRNYFRFLLPFTSKYVRLTIASPRNTSCSLRYFLFYVKDTPMFSDDDEKRKKKKQQKIRVDYKLEIILVTIGIL